jgi:nitroreductase
MLKKPIDVSVPLHALLEQRWSGRAYDKARTVAHEDLLALLEAARWSPSCYGEQPWRLLIWDRVKDPQAWQLAFDCLAEGNKMWAQDAPMLMLACASLLFSHNQQPNRWAEYDTGAASMSMSMQATALGLMVHQMGGFDALAIQDRFAIPAEYRCLAMLTVGYQLDADRIPDALRERELTPRSRKPLETLFFSGQWGQGVDLL